MTDIIYTAIRILAGFGAFCSASSCSATIWSGIAGNKLKSLFDRTSQKTLAGVGLGRRDHGGGAEFFRHRGHGRRLRQFGRDVFEQAASLLLGANIGTVITAQLAALQSFDAAAIFMAFVLVGVLVERFSKKDKAKSGGLALAGFGLVFLGLDVMSGTLRLYMEGGGAAALFSGLSNPVLLLLLGALLAALVQSSGAVAAVVVTVAAGGICLRRGRQCRALSPHRHGAGQRRGAPDLRARRQCGRPAAPPRYISCTTCFPRCCSRRCSSSFQTFRHRRSGGCLRGRERGWRCSTRRR